MSTASGAWKRWPRLARPAFRPSTDIGTTALPNSATSQCTGRTNCSLRSPQRIGLGIGMALIDSATMSGSSSSVRLPARSLRATKRSPLASLMRSRCSMAKPFFCANARSAGVGWPSASSAMLTYGPNTSDFCAGCSAATASTRTAKRRGAYSTCAAPALTPRLARPSAMPRAKASARAGSAFGGSSSVPSSINRDCVFMRTPLSGSGSPASRAGRNRLRPPRATACARAGCSAGVRSPKWRGGRRAG